MVKQPTKLTNGVRGAGDCVLFLYASYDQIYSVSALVFFLRPLAAAALRRIHKKLICCHEEYVKKEKQGTKAKSVATTTGAMPNDLDEQSGARVAESGAGSSSDGGSATCGGKDMTLAEVEGGVGTEETDTDTVGCISAVNNDSITAQVQVEVPILIKSLAIKRSSN